MSRLTGTDAYGLMEAYQAVYAPQELTEEQVWEEVENWVNSLLEEGYDLSNYTWEEMYESYLNEISIRDVTAGARQNLNRAASTVSDIAGSGLRGYAGKTTTSTNPISRTFNAATRGVRDAAAGFVTGRGSTPEAKPSAPASGDYKSRFAGARDAAVARAQNIKGSPVVGPGLKGGVTAAPARTPSTTRPAAPKVSPSTPAKPAGPAMGKLGGTTFERRTPTSAELKAAQAARAGGASPEKALQAAKSAGGALSQATAAASKPTAFSPTPAAAKTAPTPVAPKQTPRQARLNMEMEYDAYDLVLEYLLSEGHVETVEEAHYVMMEMDAEMIGTIVEAAADQSDEQIDRGVKTTYKAQNVLDNQHQGRSKGLNKLPRGEREEKAKRMQGRLKARRDDLFGERNKREDSKREQLKKMLGL
jgi:hypothetical protein